ncbi:hypothetical protein ASPVEDRAFT_46518 [Aspergillus versicolor CBS 583.65]|uniref:Gfo/Idh/MocA-like oxidoreductase C-terminal domain-containing protein n=1 Tax=Aspergillus versicolor CBS 583.65 TaxID=1036611 RepID=A0A1L9Q026_ASPVE|nr:uncharacterized protein ASPVEDRAFT_46518 [Aspergillus versicolor CBS 583.65]OJJ07139.1 hypothetical protein ASPVEDRAFT_46518 [Aspergillus versicolor CBS 583.65]
MDKPVTTRPGSCTSASAALGIAEDFEETHARYLELQRTKKTFFQIHSQRRFHPGFHHTFDLIKDVAERTNCPVTNIISTHCDGMWRMPPEIVEQTYHSFSHGYGKVSHSGYHFLDMCYLLMRMGWGETKRPERAEVVSSFITPNGFLTSFNDKDYKSMFGTDYNDFNHYTQTDLMRLTKDMGEIDSAIQVTFFQGKHPIALAQINLQHNGSTRRSWLKAGPDLYKGIGRVKHEFHEIKSGPLQTVVIDSRQANDKHDRSVPSTAKMGSDNHFEVHVFRNSDLLNETAPFHSYSVDDLDRRYKTDKPGLYSENIKRGILQEAIDFVNGKRSKADLSSPLTDHDIPVHLMSAVYLSHVRRAAGGNPIVDLKIDYNADGEAQGSIHVPVEPVIAVQPQTTPGHVFRYSALFSGLLISYLNLAFTRFSTILATGEKSFNSISA